MDYYDDIIRETLGMSHVFGSGTATYVDPYDTTILAIMSHLTKEWKGVLLTAPKDGAAFRIRQAQGPLETWPTKVMSCIGKILDDSSPSAGLNVPVVEVSVQHQIGRKSTTKFCYIYVSPDSIIKVLWKALMRCGVCDVTPQYLGMSLKGFIRLLRALHFLSYHKGRGPENIILTMHPDALRRIAKPVLEAPERCPGPAAIGRLFQDVGSSQSYLAE